MIYRQLIRTHIAELIDMEMKEVSWKYDYNSIKGGVNKHWHILWT